MRKERFDITGMTCSACSARVEKAVANLEGVAEASVNLLTNSMSLTFDDQAISADAIVAAVQKAGYGASVHAGEQGAAQSATTGTRGASRGPDSIALEMQEMKTRLFVSILFTLPLFYLAMGPMAGLPLPGFFDGPENALAFAFSQFLLTIPVIFVNFKYYRVGFSVLLARAPNMDSLIAIGSAAAALFGIYAIYKIGAALGRGDAAIAHHFAMNLYFDSAAMILTLITLGKFFEARAKGKTSDAIAKLMELAPETATISRDGIEEVIPIQAVQAGDTLIVKAGERIPVDGKVVAGSAFVDQSALTGESIPVEKQPGDAVTGATINTSGHLKIRATRVGDDTTLAQIVKLVDEATASKAPIGRLADKISGIFVPVVIAVAVLATATWLLLGYGVEFALSIGIAVLVISCPCALGLATPTAIMVGTGRGAASGILFKSAEAIEIAHAVDTVVLDKTGTITEGKPQLTDLAPAAGVREKELLSLAASLEKLSEHPLGQAIVQAAEGQGFSLSEVSEFKQQPGEGISGQIGGIDGTRIFAGNERLLASQGIAISEGLRKQADALAADGKTVLYFLRGQEFLGLIAVADVIKANSREAVAELEDMGMQVIMLTGDNAVTARAVQRQAGIAQVRAEVLPQDKESEIRRLQEEGRKVVMAGDGINDAPALARADVGIAVGAGTDVAIESADVVLMKSDLLDVANAIQLSRAVMRTIRQNLFWAFFYNAVGIPVAAGVFYGIWHLTLSPMLAAAAMSMSSVSVVTNALRLRFFTPKRHSAYRATDKEHYIEASATGAGSLPNPSPQIRSTIMTKQIHIDGMSCGHCSASVEKALRAVAGVREVSVDLAAKMATVQVDDTVTNDTLSKAVTDSGYTVIGID